MIEFGKMKLLPVRICVITIVLYALLWVVPDKKIAIGVMMCYVGVVAWVLQDVAQALVISYLAFIPVGLGKFFPVVLVSPIQLNIPYRFLGITAHSTVTMRDVAVVLMGVLSVRQSIRQRMLFWPRDAVGWILLVLPVGMALSAFLGSVIPDISFVQALVFIEPFIVYTYVTRVLPRLDLQLVMSVLIAGLGFESVVAGAQYVRGAPLGLLIEGFPGFIPVDTNPDATFAYRFGGTFTHANILAHYLIFSLFLVIPVLFDRHAYVRRFGAFAVTLGLMALTLTQSRSAWIAGVFALLFFFFYIEKVRGHRPAIPVDVRPILYMSLPIILAVVWYLVFPRLAGTAYTFTPYGSGGTRLGLLTDAIRSARMHPLFGVGLSMDVYASYLGSVVRHVPYAVFIPEPVHNGFAELFVETGIVGFGPYVLVLFGLGWIVWREMKKSRGVRLIYLSGAAAGVIAVLVNSQLQPLLPDLQELTLLVMIYASFSAARKASYV